MKLAKPYKLTWYFFVIFVLVVLAFGSYVYFSKGKIFRNTYTEGLNSCPSGQVSCTIMTEPGNYCSNKCVDQGTCPRLMQDCANP